MRNLLWLSFPILVALVLTFPYPERSAQDWDKIGHDLSQLEYEKRLKICYDKIYNIPRGELLIISGCNTAECFDSFVQDHVNECMKRG